MTSNPSLFGRIVRYVIAALLLIALPLGLVGHWLIGQSNDKNARASMMSRASLVAQLLEVDLRSKLVNLEQTVIALEVLDEDQTIRRHVERISEFFDGVSWAGLTDVQGKVRFATNGLLEGQDVSARPWFQEGRQKPTIMDVHDAFLLASKLPQREDGYKFIDLAVPVIDREGKVDGVLAIHFDWTWYKRKVDSLLVQNADALSYSVLVTAADGDFRAAKLPDGYTSRNLEAMIRDLRKPNKTHVGHLSVTFEPPKASLLGSLGWRVHILVPEGTVHEQTNVSVVFAILTLVLGMLIVAGLVIALSRRVSGQVAKHLNLMEQGITLQLDRNERKMPAELLPVLVRIRELYQGVNLGNQKLQIELKKAQHSYAEISSIVKQAPVALALFDQDFYYLGYSNLWRQLFVGHDTSLPKRARMIEHGEIPAHWLDACERALSNETFSKTDDEWVQKDGTKRWLDWTIQPWHSKAGSVGGVIVSAVDVTQEHEALAALAQSQERFKLAMEGSSDGLWDWDIIGESVYFSPSWKRMLGYSDEELKSSFQTWRSLLHPEDFEYAIEHLRQVLSDSQANALNISFRLAHKNGTWVKVLSRAKILRDETGRACRVVGTHLDRTEIERLQSELQEAQVLVEAETRSNEMKSRFLANMSHEIRNPLNAVTGFARLIAEETAEPAVSRYAKLLNQTTESLRLLLNDILDVAKIEANKLELVETVFNLPDLCESLVESARFQCEEKLLHFEFNRQWVKGAHYLSDAGKIRQIIQNLLTNALKFTERGSVTLTVNVVPLNEEIDRLTLTVADTGRGIPEAKKDRLFKPFSQMHDDSGSELGGTGLGLTIVKSLAEMLGGQVNCQSVENEGSVFTVSLQLKRHSAPNRVQLERTIGAPPKRILIVDDMRLNVQILDSFLGKRGHHLEHAKSGTEALKLLRNKPYDHVFMDLDMPDFSGIEVLNQLLSHNEAGQVCYSGLPNPAMHFTCVTGHVMQDTMEAIVRAGFHEFLPKPIDFDRVLSILADSENASASAEAVSS